MPRKPKFIHPLREIRRTMGSISQPAFAKKIGCSPATIQAIENGKLKMSRGIALKIFAETGCDIDELMKGKGGKALAFYTNKKPFTLDSYAEWQKGFGNPSKMEIESLINDLSKPMAVLISAAARPGTGKLRSVFAAIGHSFENILKDYHLEKQVKEVMRERGKVERVSHPVSFWRKLTKIEQNVWGFKDNRNLKGSDIFTGECLRYSEWRGCGWEEF